MNHPPSDFKHSVHRTVISGKIVLWASAVLLFLWIVDQNFVPNGFYYASCTARDCSKSVSAFATKEPDVVIGKSQDSSSYRLIAHDPVYMTIQAPKPFASATVSAEFANPNQLSAVNFGLQGANGHFTIKNAYTFDSQIEELEQTWNKVTSKEDPNVVLYERPSNSKKKNNAKPYASVEEFLSDLPSRSAIRTYNYDMSPYIAIPGYTPAQNFLNMETTLRGSHDIVFYLGQEDLNMEFTLQEINRHAGADDVSVLLSKNGRVILEKTVADDGIVAATGEPSDPEFLALHEKLTPGVYTISIKIEDDDVFIRSIKTKQHLIMFRDHIYLADNDEYAGLGGIVERPTTLLTTGSTITAHTSHAKGLQTIFMDQQLLRIEEVDEFMSVTRETAGVARIVSPKNDVYIKTNGYFAFGSDQMFDSTFGIASLSGKLSDSVLYIIAQYLPKNDVGGGWARIEAGFSGKEMYRAADGTYTFILQAPGLYENNNTLKLRSISVEFRREPITLFNVWDKMWSKLKQL